VENQEIREKERKEKTEYRKQKAEDRIQWRKPSNR
jgi:hypothetical protein